MTPGQLLLIAAGCVAAGIICGAWWPRVWLGLTLAGTTALLSAAVSVLSGLPEWQLLNGPSVGGEPLHLRLDGLSALFLA